MEFYDLQPKRDDFMSSAIEGLSEEKKVLHPKFFYDDEGSRLFEEITELPEYYLTKAEIEILETHAKEMASYIDPEALLIEFGSGASRKIRILLDAFDKIAAYVPIDISKNFLMSSAKKLNNDYPDLRIIGVCADYTKSLHLPESLWSQGKEKVVFFPGSTIGNLSRKEANEVLRNIRNIIEPKGYLILGTDLHKSSDTLQAAYNDQQGTTAAFNKNVLRRMNRELGANFKLTDFDHHAFYNREEKRIEMHLVSKKSQTVRIDGHSFDFDENETIHTENSYKYTLDGFEALAQEVGLKRIRYWTDRRNLFGVQFLSSGMMHKAS